MLLLLLLLLLLSLLLFCCYENINYSYDMNYSYER